MKGQVFESPRGPVLIDAQTRDIVQDIYIRKVERKDGQLWNVEFDVLKAVKDPGKLKSDALSSRLARRCPAGASAPASARMLTLLFDGIAYGMLLFVLAVGLAVTLGLMNFINLAHGAFAMAGGYITVLLMKRAGVPFLACLPVAFVVAAACSARCSSARCTGRCTRKPHLDQVLFSIGLVFMAVATVDYFVGSQQQTIQLPAWLQGALRDRRRSASARYRLFIIVVCAALALGAAGGAGAHALRQPPARRGRRPARRRGPRHRRQPRVPRDLRGRLAAWPGSAARSGAEVLGLDPTFPLKFMIYFLIVCRRRRHDHDHRPAAGGAAARHRRRDGQVLRAQARRLHRLHADDR